MVVDKCVGRCLDVGSTPTSSIDTYKTPCLQGFFSCPIFFLSHIIYHSQIWYNSFNLENRKYIVMTLKKTIFLLTLPCFGILLIACSSSKVSDHKEAKKAPQVQVKQAEHQDIRAKFEKVTLAKADSGFTGGTTLEELTDLFGEPASHSTRPAGNVSLDSYVWKFDHVAVTIDLYENSSILKTIANFAFQRDLSLSQKEYKKLQKGMTYAEVKKLLTEPDNYSQASSSDKESLQAIWISGLKTHVNGANISLSFENDQLTEMSQVGLE